LAVEHWRKRGEEPKRTGTKNQSTGNGRRREPQNPHTQKPETRKTTFGGDDFRAQGGNEQFRKFKSLKWRHGWRHLQLQIFGLSKKIAGEEKKGLGPTISNAEKGKLGKRAGDFSDSGGGTSLQHIERKRSQRAWLDHGGGGRGNASLIIREAKSHAETLE